MPITRQCPTSIILGVLQVLSLFGGAAYAQNVIRGPLGCQQTAIYIERSVYLSIFNSG